MYDFCRGFSLQPYVDMCRRDISNLIATMFFNLMGIGTGIIEESCVEAFMYKFYILGFDFLVSFHF